VRLLQDVPIRQKLILISMLVSAAALFLAGVGFLGVELLEYQEARERSLTTVGEVIAANTTAALAFEDASAAEDTLAALRAERAIASACLYGADGALFAYYFRVPTGSGCSKKAEYASGASGDGAEGMALWFPVKMGESRLGSLVVRSEPIPWLERLTRRASILIVVVLLSLAVATPFASRLQHAISAPLQRLVHVSRKISVSRDYTLRVPDEGHDELGKLIASFNEMLGQIEVRDQELERRRDELDEKVQARTAELVDVIEKLRQEIEQRERAEERIRYLAYYDVLTGLPNRQFLKDRLEEALLSREDNYVALLFVDLDRFKEVNDSLGHAIGDILLKHVAQRIQYCVRRTDCVSRNGHDDEDTTVVSRQGGDEFIVLLGWIREESDAGLVAERIATSLEDPFQLGDREVVIGASVGVAVCPGDGEDSGTLMKHADIAMYHAKDAEGELWSRFSSAMIEAQLRRINTESQLRKAIELDEFEVFYQPRVHLASGAVDGLEALIRWNHPERGLVFPGDFIAEAEASGLIVPIGDRVIEMACRQCVDWMASGIPALRVAVNVASAQFRSGRLRDKVKRVLADTGLPPTSLEIEITESTMLENDETVVRTLSELRELGVQVALDDFGTG
jgi:diguanylate cyclase (GGDEF)-like protein